MAPKPTGKNKKPETAYPAIEMLLEEDKPDFSGMLARHEQLEALSASSKTPKDKALAKQAASAYGNFFELYRTLLEIKEKMQLEQINQKKQGRKK